MPRPELVAPPEIFYNKDEAAKYFVNSRMQHIQRKMAQRAYELLNLPPNVPPLLFLDIGCGSGLSGQVLEKKGHQWVGVDISIDMLNVARERGVKGQLVNLDIGDGLPFRPASFDGAISVSTLQWLCNADKSSHVPQRRLRKFFTSLYGCLRRGARAVFQFYPQDRTQLQFITNEATRVGFTGGVVIDYPHSARAKKFFLCLFAGPSSVFQLPEGKVGSPKADVSESSEDDDEDDQANDGEGDEEDEEGEEGEDEEEEEGENPNDPYLNKPEDPLKVQMDTYRSVHITERQKKGKKRARSSERAVGSKDWVLYKKEQMRQKGKKTARDSKYSARKRRRLAM